MTERVWLHSCKAKQGVWVEAVGRKWAAPQVCNKECKKKGGSEEATVLMLKDDGSYEQHQLSPQKSALFDGGRIMVQSVRTNSGTSCPGVYVQLTSQTVAQTAPTPQPAYDTAPSRAGLPMGKLLIAGAVVAGLILMVVMRK